MYTKRLCKVDGQILVFRETPSLMLSEGAGSVRLNMRRSPSQKMKQAKEEN
jgi:hypothetical protein